MSENKVFYFLKGIGCLAIIFIHVKFPGKFGEIISLLCQFAVPIFLMISGYYAYKCDEKVIKRRLYKVIKIFIFALSIWTLYKVAMEFLNGDIRSWLATVFTIKSLLRAIIFCTIDYAIPLWYLIAMIETYIVWYFIIKYHKNSLRYIYIYIYIILLFILHITLTIICETNNFDWYLKINFLSRSMNWFLLGYSFNYISKMKMKKIKFKFLIFSYLLGILLSIVPTILNTSINFSCIGIVVFSTTIFVIALKLQNKSINKIIEYIGKKLSLYVYIFHSLMASVLSFVSSKLINFNIENTFYFPIIVLICTVIFCHILNIIFKRKDIKL